MGRNSGWMIGLGGRWFRGHCASRVVRSWGATGICPGVCEMFNIFISGLELITERLLVKFPDDPKQEEAVNLLPYRGS